MTRLNRDDIDKFYDYDLHVPTRTIYMGSMSADDDGESGTDFAMAEHVVKGLHLLDRANSEPITVLMNNLGGDVVHGMAIYDAIRGCRSEITVRAVGHAMSMGSIIMQAADVRQMMPNSWFMIHYGTDSLSNHSKIVAAWARWSERFNKQMEDLYLDRIRAKHPTFSRAKLQKMLNFDSILSADETVALGLADEVVRP